MRGVGPLVLMIHLSLALRMPKRCNRGLKSPHRSLGRIAQRAEVSRLLPACCDNVGTMIHVIASIRVKEGALDEYVSLFKENVPNVLAEDGCVQYAPCVDAETGWKTQALDHQRMTVVEQWESMEALQAHTRAPHMAAFRQKAGHLVEGMSLQVVQDA